MVPNLSQWGHEKKKRTLAVEETEKNETKEQRKNAYSIWKNR
jgi:hypothetical protein